MSKQIEALAQKLKEAGFTADEIFELIEKV